jgi:hypothetical protein
VLIECEIFNQQEGVPVTNFKKASMAIGVVLLVFLGVSYNSKHPSHLGNVERDIQKWKEELVAQKRVGRACHFESLDTPEAQKWREDNPHQMFGLPKNDKDIGIAKHDWDGDGQLDLFVYFSSDNCSGRNGGTPSFAKIIYATGAVNSDVATEINTAIVNAYQQMRVEDARLKEIQIDYLPISVAISYDKQIRGDVKLYAPDDAHCCPSYKGKYTYDPHSKKAILQI